VRPFAPGAEIAPGMRVLRHLNRSNQADAYEAWSELRACRVVVKTLRPDRRGEPSARAALLREGRLLRRLSHPNIVRGFDVHDGPRPMVFMEAVGGETLAHLMRRRRRHLGVVELAHLGLHLGSALTYLHAEGILHLDLKPSNVVAEAGRAKLLDLSVARGPGRIRAGTGTWSNMAPEQARGGEVDAAADVWGLGTVLYEAAAGINPFEEHDEIEYPQLVHPAPRLASQRRAPPAFTSLVDACLDPERSRRPTLAELRAELAPLARERLGAD
jgi:serine/threonine protein kinase